MSRVPETRPVSRAIDPFADFDLFGPSLFRRLASDTWPTRAVASGEGHLMPAMSVAERPDAYQITAELPGCSSEDVTVEVHDGVLSIRGEKKSETDTDRDHLHFSERTYGQFSRAIKLPANADDQNVEAKFADGVLTVDLKKVEESKPRVVRIES